MTEPLRNVNGALVFSVAHPQWGGYAAGAEVEFFAQQTCGKEPGCFELRHWHDGEFPNDDGTPDEKHYCDVMQILRLGVQILELQIEHQKQPDGSPLKPHGLAEVIQRLQQLQK